MPNDAYVNDYHKHKEGQVIKTWNILPESSAKPLADYIPQAIREDYYEACLILNKSPKASATLSRRCLQGMIRDFWGIKKGSLYNQIEKLEEKEPGVKDLIDPIREFGNIGAHMESDVNLIIDVEPEEAQLLINLLEDLFEDWYIARHNQQERQRLLAEKVAAKKRQKQQSEDAA